MLQIPKVSMDHVFRKIFLENVSHINEDRESYLCSVARPAQAVHQPEVEPSLGYQPSVRELHDYVPVI